MSFTEPKYLWLIIKPTRIIEGVDTLQNICIHNLKKNGSFDKMIRNIDNFCENEEDKILFNLFNNIIYSKIGLENKGYFEEQNIKSKIKYGFNVLKFHHYYAEKIYKKEIYTRNITFLESNIRYKMYRYRIIDMIPILRNLKKRLKMEKQKIYFEKPNFIKIVIRNEKERDIFNDFLTSIYSKWEFKKMLCLENQFIGEIDLIIHFEKN